MLAWTFWVSPAAQAVPITTWDIANATGQSASVGFTETGISATDLAAVGVNPWPTFTQDGFVVASGWAPGLALLPLGSFARPARAAQSSAKRSR